MRSHPLLLAIAAGAVLALAACKPSDFTEAEKQTIASLSLAALPPLPADPTNRHAEDPAAAALGATLFFEQRLSRDGDVACATCHKIDRQFQDDLPLAKGAGTTNRRTMPLAGVAWSPWQFWDGRKDSLWSQALGPLESAVEHAGNRTAYAKFVAAEYGERYARIFGPLPKFEGLPDNAGPFGTAAEKAAWAAMSEEQRDSVNRVFANIGKSIAAFERSIVPQETRFDRFAAALAAGKKPEGDAAFTDQEIEGLKIFIGEGNCVNCHNGPRFTDDHFHNTGVPQAKGLPQDRGRAGVIEDLLADPFNCLGKYSDAGPEACGEIRFMVRQGHELERAFKTPSLRGVASRPPYMHSGQIATLDEVLDHYDSAPEAPSGESELENISLTGSEREALIAFLKTLDPLPAPSN